ncbi:extradiol dioxygenase [Parapedobacter pyrenivorans]|uniref:Extradiol dioxygenase n=1 Tax=Parapedobacter pyrenivorans TaxID=1305674 RepID=A0A917HY00_9SPHI|nr:VOC family protein [Parapedobacter pyrenivorans]GGG97465.1 extradiol dioxygenase [Parapedobacter pyrenivorans]
MATNIPKQYNRIMPYLILKDARDFLRFMERVFDAQEQLIVPGENGGIMHGELRIGDDTVIMFAEASDQFTVMNAGLYIHVEDADTTYEKALQAGAKTVPGQEPSDKDYGRTCGVKDPFGNTWWITAVSQ